MDEKDEKLVESHGEEKAGGNVAALVKKYRGASRLLLPRAIFIMMVCGAIVIFASSLFMGAGVSLFSALASSGNPMATILFLVLELLFVFCMFVIQYGLFLSNLRFVRNQPVAISFLFAGFRQRRARKFAAFFIVPLFVAFLLATAMFLFDMVGASHELEEALDQMTRPAHELPEFLSAHPQILQMMFRYSAAFFLLALVLYFPFTFVWPHVYDEMKIPFSAILSKSLKFWKGRFLKFLGFEIAANYKAALVSFAGGALEIFLVGKFPANVAAQIISSLLGFVSFCATIFFFASVILSINFFYDEFVSGEGKSAEQGQNENPHEESSN